MKQFIEDAIAGGWNPTEEKDWCINNEPTGELTVHFYDSEYPEEGTQQYQIYEVLLDPTAWQAVGKTRGWSEDSCRGCGKQFNGTTATCCNRECKNPQFASNSTWEYVYQMHTFLDHLIDGLSIEEALKEIR